MIDPKIEHRFTLDQIKSRWKTPEEAFSNGDYTIIPSFKNAAPEIIGKAYIMLGNPQKGLDVFSQNHVKTWESCYYQSYALWCLNRKNEALNLIDEVVQEQPDKAHYRALQKLLNREKIPAILLGTMSMQIVPYLKNSPSFSVLTIGTSDQFDITIDVNDKPTALQEQLPELPLFSLSFGPEVLSLPSDFPNLPFCKLGFVLDYDISIATKYDQISAFDSIICYSSPDHFEQSQIYDRPTHTYHPFEYLPDILNATRTLPQQRSKNYDIFFTGYAFDTFFYSKAQVLYKLTTLDPSCRVLINQNDTRLSIGEYLDHLASAKFIPTVIRFQGGFSTRGIEAIHSGSCTLVQEGSFMSCCLNGQDDGLYEYRYDNMVSQIEGYIRNESDTRQPIPSSATLALFDPNQNIETLLKFCAFLAIQNNSFADVKKRRQPLPFSTSGFHFENESNLVKFHQDIVTLNLSTSPKQLTHFLRASAAAVYNFFNENTDRFDEIKNIYEEGLRQYPDALALHFNYGRTLFHAGFTNKSREHLLLVVANDTDWNFDPLHHDLFCPMKFFKDDFPYIDYIDQVIKGKIDVDNELRRRQMAVDIIQSGAYYYLAKEALSREETDQTIHYCQQSLVCYSANFITQAFFVPVIWHRYHSSDDKSKLTILLDCFYLSVEKFPMYLHQNIIYAVESELSLGNKVAARELLQQWFLFFERVRINFDRLTYKDDFIDFFCQRKHLFPSDAIPLFEKVVTVINLLRQPKQYDFPLLSEHESSIFIAYLKTVALHKMKEPLIRFINVQQNDKHCPMSLLLYFAEVFLDLGDDTHAQQMISYYLDNSAKNVQMTKIYYMAYRLEQNNQLQGARIVYEKLLQKRFDKSWLIYFRLGQMAKNNTEEAIDHYSKALAIFPNFIKAQKELDKLLTDKQPNS